jgi:hypothetical protein
VNAKVAVEIGIEVGCACSVCATTAETVPATIIAIRSVSTVSVGSGAGAVGDPGTTQAIIAAKNIGTIKSVRLLFMFSSSMCEIKKPPDHYSREAFLE